MNKNMIELFNKLKKEGYIDDYKDGKIEFIDFVTLDECTEYLNKNKSALDEFMYDIEMMLFSEICD
ncbi:hypothetical protein [Peptostreptococcus porci]|uniref:hypothetical protein n=1 Tax=Peptostreptococcus porci TaxID=2652282 RepID=UPI002A7F76F0|nr:hypothetical protein [Peptostreptococcus porci]MDY4127621.1 hypothetical protein [Peptostreptococcus porci]